MRSPFDLVSTRALTKRKMIATSKSLLVMRTLELFVRKILKVVVSPQY